MQSTVYLITCPLGLRYVGGTTQELKVRLSKHRSERSGCRLIRDAIHTHGWENMNVSILMTCPMNSLEQNESLYIEALDTVHPRGYNLRCGSKAGAPSPGGMEVSTLVLDPTEATDEMRKAVQEDIEEITGTRPLAMTWCGPVSVSIDDLNRMRGASMNLPWAGPVKGVPVDATATRDPEFDDIMPFVNARKMERTCNLWLRATDAEADTRYVIAQHAKDKSWAERSIAVTKAAIEARSNEAIAKNRELVHNEIAQIDKLQAQLIAAEKMDMTEEAVGIKRKLRDAILA